MKKYLKLVLLIPFLYFVTGCTSTVNITITPEKIDEEIIINADDESEYVNSVTAYYEDIMEIEDEEEKRYSDIEYYDSTKTLSGSGYKFYYTYSFPISKYLGAQSLNTAFTSSSIVSNNSTNILTFKINNRKDVNNQVYKMLLFDNYPALEKVTVNITSDMEFITNNADSASGNTYTWVFTREDRNKTIEFILDTKGSVIDEITTTSDFTIKDLTTTTTPITEEVSEGNQDETTTSNTSNISIGYVILAVIAAIIFIGVIFVLEIRKNKNQ